MTNHELIDLCKRSDSRGQRLLYDQFITRLTRLCLRYVKDENDTKDVLTEAFMKIFRHIHSFNFLGEGSLEAWMKGIVINQSLMFLRKNKNLMRTFDIEKEELSVDASIEIKLAADELYNMIMELPLGYRTIFNLYAIEGYSHQEIASQLGISESTSRSQLAHARQNLKKSLLKNK